MMELNGPLSPLTAVNFEGFWLLNGWLAAPCWMVETSQRGVVHSNKSEYTPQKNQKNPENLQKDENPKKIRKIPPQKI